MQVTAKTLSNRLRERETSFRHHLPPEELVRIAAEVAHINENGRATGHRGVQAALFDSAGIGASRADVLEALRMHDPAALQARRERILPRRTYNVTQSMMLWHVDGDSSSLKSRDSCALLLFTFGFAILHADCCHRTCLCKYLV